MRFLQILALSTIVFSIVTNLVKGLATTMTWKKAQQIRKKSNTLASAQASLPLQSTASSSEKSEKDITIEDRRPHEQRTTKPRKARRLNHSFQHLYRHDSNPSFDDRQIALSSRVLTNATCYLMEYGGYTIDQVLEMQQSFPPLLELDVKRHLRPKLRFLKHTLGGIGSHPRNDDARKGPVPLVEWAKTIPPQYYGARLERTVAPRHAFLVYNAEFGKFSLPYGRQLLKDNAKLLNEFLVASRRVNTFCALCNRWKKEFGDAAAEIAHDSGGGGDSIVVPPSDLITPQQVEAFDALFQRGLMAAARNDMDPQNQYLIEKQQQQCDATDVTVNTKHFKENNNNNNNNRLNITSGQMINLLVRHGANPLEKDVRDVSLLHWAAGCGNIDALVELIGLAIPRGGFNNGSGADMRASNSVGKSGIGWKDIVNLKAERDGATLLHWAVAGAKSKEFGCGGHLNVVRFLLMDDDKFEYNYDFILGQHCRKNNISATNMGNDDDVGTHSRTIQSKRLSGVSSSYPSMTSTDKKKVVNAKTLDGNSILMWAAWSGTLDVVKHLIRQHRADYMVQNRNGCTVAHWAASGGDLNVCKYLHNAVGVDFTVENKAGNTPLSHAVAYGRVKVVEWLLKDVVGVENESGRDAMDLAWDFVGWEEKEGSKMGSSERRKVFDLFGDYWYDNDDEVASIGSDGLVSSS